MSTQRITQETFDDVVKENMQEFDMNPEDALREAVEQFVSQGVNLSFIVKALPTASPDGKQEGKTHEVLQALESLRVGQDASSTERNTTADLKRFIEQCSLGFAQRYLAAQNGAYAIILSCCRKSLEKQGDLLVTLAALAMLTDGQPDLLDKAGVGLLMSILRRYQADPAVTRAGLRTVRHCCLKHEQNRIDLVTAGVVPLMTGAICKHIRCAELVKEASAALKVMTFDDDIRVPFGRAHEHAKLIVTQHSGLKVIIEAAKAHPDKISVISELCATLSRLAVRNEFCQDICDLGGLKLLMTLLADSFETQEIVRQVLSAIRAIAGNDDMKDMVVSAGGVQLIVVAMNAHMSNSNVCEHGCACLSVLALRKPNNCLVIMDNGGAMAAIQAMKAHPGQVNVQKQACMLMRNLVSHTNNFSQPILQMGAEDLIAEALRSYQEDCGDVCRAALRDLGCRVVLRELWTGEKGSIGQ